MSQRSIVPVVKGLPIIGSIPSLLLNQLDAFDSAFARYGEIFAFDLGLTKVVVVGSPELAEEILVEDSSSYSKDGDFWDTLRQALGNGLPVNTGDSWAHQRRLMTPEFRRARLRSFQPLISQIVERKLDSLGAGDQPVDVESWAYQLMTTITLNLLMGADLSDEDIDRLRPSMSTLLDHALLGVLTSNLPSWVPNPGQRSFDNARRAVDDKVYALIRQRREHPSDSHDLLSILLAALDHDGQIDEKQLRDELVALYIGGYETTGSALAWTLYLLATHPRILATLRAELDDSPTPLDTPYLDACVREGLRLYPPGPLIPRHSVGATSLGPKHFAIAPRTSIMVAPWLIQRSAAHWDDPNRFDPTRFHAQEHKHRHRLAWCPFGAGRRICIGKELALMELRTSIALLVERFDFEPTPTKPRVRLSTTLRSKSGVWIRVRPRARH